MSLFLFAVRSYLKLQLSISSVDYGDLLLFVVSKAVLYCEAEKPVPGSAVVNAQHLSSTSLDMVSDCAVLVSFEYWTSSLVGSLIRSSAILVSTCSDIRYVDFTNL